MKTLWDVKAGVYDRLRRLPFSRTIYEREIRNLASMVPQRQVARHLDIGTGTGSSLFIFPQPEKLLVISDISRGMLHAAQRMRTLPAVQFDAGARLPFADDVFDLISAIGVTEYILDLAYFLRETRRITTPEADLIMTSSPPRFATRLRRLNGARPTARSDAQVKKTLREAGWQIIASDTSFMQTQWLCRKAPGHHENSMAHHKNRYAL